MITEIQPNRCSLSPAHSDAASFPDAELVRRFNSGDESAFAEIVARFRAPVFSIAFSHLHDRFDAEEVVQDTFIRVYRGLAAFRGESSLSTWIHQIAVNTARNRYWYFFRRRRHLGVSLDQPIGEDGTGTLADLIASPGDEAEEIRAQNEFVDAVAECMEKLDSHQRAILELRMAKNLSYEEIATELGIQVGTVKSRIARARERLRALVARSRPEFVTPVGGFKVAG